MARIRTLKPEFWKHEGLSELPEATHMLAAALLNYADDEGYFNANPRLVHAECCPLREPSVSVHESLLMLSNIAYIRLGTGQDGKRYGHIQKFAEHQRINRPTPSKIKNIRIEWEDSTSTHTQLTEPSLPEQGTGNREQGTGNREPINQPSPTTPSVSVPTNVSRVPAGSKIRPPADAPKEGVLIRKGDSRHAWAAYVDAYVDRYGTEPVRNAKVNGQMAQFVKRLPADEAPEVARWYVASNTALYVRSKHAVDLLLRDCEGLRTEWATSRRVTDTEARQADQHQSARDSARWVTENMDELRKARAEGRL